MKNSKHYKNFLFEKKPVNYYINIMCNTDSVN